jgi:hypothetical protein
MDIFLLDLINFNFNFNNNLTVISYFGAGWNPGAFSLDEIIEILVYYSMATVVLIECIGLSLSLFLHFSSDKKLSSVLYIWNAFLIHLS